MFLQSQVSVHALKEFFEIRAFHVHYSIIYNTKGVERA